ncbi:MAG: DUF349 domain-containing protein [Solobacterium sp.]|nr:DUF349 domain-containing protein [Solobacterium sp.]
MNKPVFNDDKLKERRREHKAFGGYVVEYLYGAKNAEGAAVEPREDADDGHGRWYGIDCGGNYTMFVWNHSREEGGETEYGTEYNENAVAVMEDQLKQKADLCRDAEEIARSYEGDDGQEKLDEVKAKWEALKDWGTPKDAELNKRFQRAADEYAPRAEAIKENKAAKLEVLAKTAEIEAMTNFKEAKNAVRKLRDELYEIGSAGEENDRAFSKQLNDLEKDIDRRRREFFDNLDSNRAAAKEKKTQIIESATNLVKNVSNWKAAGEQLNGLFADWKAAGSAGRDDDDTLWAEFNAVRDDFYAKRKVFFEERNEKFRQSVEAKKAIIEEAAKIAESAVYSRENTDRMKQLDVEWRAAGYSGKEENDRLWDEFSKTKESFWDGKKAIAVGRFQTELNEKEAKLESLKARVKDLEYRIEIAETPSIKEGVEKDIYITQSQINDLEDAISVLKDKING